MIRCVIVDDEPYAIELLEKHIQAFDDIEVAAKCKNVMEAVAVIQSEQVDLLLLDVRMPEITGIEFLENTANPPGVIFTTAYREYAVQAFEFGVLDYLVKPISFMRFAKAIERYRQVAVAGNHAAMNEPIVVKSGTEYHKVLPSDIIYINSAREYISIKCTNEQYLVRSSMNDILEQLPRNAFVQVHKSYIVPVGDIRSVTSSEVVLKGGEKVPLGKSFADVVRKEFTSRWHHT